MDTDALFLGLDSSTQALKASLLDADLRVLAELEVRFDSDLAHFGTRGGVLYGPDGSGEVFSPVLQPVEALDLLFDRIKDAQWEVGRIRGVSAAGQQHASVYWSQEAPNLLSSLDPSKPMSQQLTRAFSRGIIPNWQDSSTERECAELEAAVGGPDALARITGSKAHTRFTGSQIARFRRLEPDAYERTSRISLVSSFITTLLCADGEVKGIDESDACGMNLWDMSRPERGWNRTLLAAIGDADRLEQQLGVVETDGGRVVGHIGKWFQARYGFSPECVVVPGTGDNPATFLSLVLRPSEGMISLGTSDVVLVATEAYNPHPEFHAFFHPAMIAPPSKQDGERSQHERLRYFNMLVYKNGSLARERVRDEYFGKSWERFNAGVERLRPRKGGRITRTAFWWILPEIIPDGALGVHKYEGEDAASARELDQFTNVDAEALAIVESQMLNYRSRSTQILTDRSSGTSGTSASSASSATLSRVYATGGAAKNQSICNVMADALGCPVSKPVEWDEQLGTWRDADWNACSVGVAYKARWGYERHVAAARGDAARANISFDEFVAECHAADGGDADVAVPGEGSPAYAEAVEWWQALERRAVGSSIE